MRTVIVAISNNQYVVIFREGDDIKRTEGFPDWRDASRAILGWL